MKKISILGSTGSIGTQALEVIEKLKDKIEIIAISGGCNIALLREQVKATSPKFVSVANEADAITLSKEFPKTQFFFGTDGLKKIATLEEIDIVLVSVSGRIGLQPTIAAIKAKKQIALANKETLVMAGDIVMPLAKKYGVQILPVDSEHSAIFQCLNVTQTKPKKLIITASGGPFLNKSLEEIETCTAKEALKHPKWNMGKKITIDSATLMNKGLEVIEAHHLFDIAYEDIEVVIHPQSIVHSAIEHRDGSVIAQLGIPSMHIPIQYALTYPERNDGIKSDSFSFAQIAKLTFEEPNYDKFPALKLAYKAGKLGKTYPTVLNAANEEAVNAFLNDKIKITDIVKIVETLLDKHSPIENPSLEKIIEIDDKTRKEANELITSIYAME